MNTPERIYNWMDSQLSIARHYGGCKFDGADYFIDYRDPEQPLVRIDVLEREGKERDARLKDEREKQRAIKLAEKEAAKAAKGGLL